MGAIASQITSLLSSQMASNAENFPFDDAIMVYNILINVSQPWPALWYWTTKVIYKLNQ